MASTDIAFGLEIIYELKLELGWRLVFELKFKLGLMSELEFASVIKSGLFLWYNGRSRCRYIVSTFNTEISFRIKYGFSFNNELIGDEFKYGFESNLWKIRKKKLWLASAIGRFPKCMQMMKMNAIYYFWTKENNYFTWTVFQ